MVNSNGDKLMVKNRVRILVAYAEDALRQAMVEDLRILLPEAEIVTASGWNESVRRLGTEAGGPFNLLVMDPFFGRNWTVELEDVVGPKGKRPLNVLLTPVFDAENVPAATNYDRVADEWDYAVLNLEKLKKSLKRMGF